MTLTYQTILDTDLGPLLTASHTWKRMGDRYSILHKDYRDHVSRAASADSWQGMSAVSYKSRGQVTQEEYAGARDEARAVARLLKQAHKELTELRDALLDLKEQARSHCMSVTSTGHCRIDLPQLEAKDKEKAEYYRKHPKKRETDEQAHTDRIHRVVKHIRFVDHNFERALMARPSDGTAGLPDGFNGALDGDIRKFNLDEAVHIAHQGKDASDTQLNHFNGILKEYAKDPKFAEGFAERMGAKGTLDFWSGTAPYGHDVSKSRTKLLNETREGLGKVLGTATRTDSAAMRHWERDMLKAAPHRYGGEPGSPYGYQVMSDLMRNGNYDDHFMKKYGDSLVSFEKEMADEGSEKSPRDIWVSNVRHNPSLTPGGAGTTGLTNDWGTDPMAGLTEGLGHNPGASTDFFSDQKTFDYVVGGNKDAHARSWPEANLPYGDGRGKGFASLGHALESATTGAPYDDLSHGLHRGHDEVSVMRKVMEAYGGADSPKDHQAGIGDSLGRMGAAYVDDLNYGLENRTGSAERKGSDVLLGTHGHDFDPARTVGFLREVGSDKTSHRVMSNAQEAFIAARVHHFAGTDDAYRVAQIGAQGHGALDEARAEQIGQDFKDDDDKRNEALKEAATWKKAGASVALYAGTGAVGGLAGEGISTFAVPVATGGGGSGLISAINNSIDADVQANQQDSTPKSIEKLDDFNIWGERNASQVVDRYMTEQGVGEEEWRQHETETRDAYQAGKEMTDTDNADR